MGNSLKESRAEVCTGMPWTLVDRSVRCPVGLWCVSASACGGCCRVGIPVCGDCWKWMPTMVPECLIGVQRWLGVGDATCAAAVTKEVGGGASHGAVCGVHRGSHAGHGFWWPIYPGAP